ncbi:hypothetical protein LTR53_000705 [Teratosphaeriaceae sp. CCFEE 6253]|nr:hypothetical protein LTR53_000705 [Teratosphaeriaceae sp. CCFEE 6253]
MDGTIPISAVSSVLGTAIGITQKAFEIYAVDEQAKSLLKTVEQVSCELREARTLRRQKSSLFTTMEKRIFDSTFERTEAAVSLVAALAEPARADLAISGGRVRFATRVLFVLRDSPRIQVCLTQLGIASQSLNRDIGTLCSRAGRTAPAMPGDGHSTLKPPPPTYEEALFMSERRRRNTQRWASARSLDSQSNTPTLASRSSVSLLISGEGESVAEETQDPIIPNTVICVPPDAQPKADSHQTDGPSTAIDQPQRRRSGRTRGLHWLEAHGN